MHLRYAGSAVFSAATVSLAALLCYLGIAANGSLLGKSPDTGAYVEAVIYTSSYFATPLLIGASCSPFIELRTLAWLALVFTGLGTWADFSYGNTFLALLIFPFNLIASWAVAISCLRNIRTPLAIPVFAACAVGVLASVIAYAKFTDRKAEQKAQSFCGGTPTGQRVERLLERAEAEKKAPEHVRWIQVHDSIKDSQRRVQVLYRGTNLIRIHTCSVKITDGVTAGAQYLLE